MFWCLIDDQPIVLDIQRDRYCLLTGKTAVALAALDPDAAAPDKRAVLEQLAMLNIVAAQTSEISPPCSHRIAEREIQHLPPPSWLDLTEVMIALFRSFSQRRWALAKRVDEFRRRKARTPSAPDLPLAPAEAVASAFDRSRRLTLGFDQCLVRAFALATTLLTRGYHPAIIFGVQLRPFAAHCWVELDGRLMDDRIAHVSLFTPILVL
ncbi:lasso peptide biosynthesis B2 protein [Sphingomonas crocodyli]|nr:lasso peptide biosynthesis B2 protein [Sphingomonas crocodyli]